MLVCTGAFADMTCELHEQTRQCMHAVAPGDMSRVCESPRSTLRRGWRTSRREPSGATPALACANLLARLPVSHDVLVGLCFAVALPITRLALSSCCSLVACSSMTYCNLLRMSRISATDFKSNSSGHSSTASIRIVSIPPVMNDSLSCLVCSSYTAAGTFWRNASSLSSNMRHTR